MGSDERGLIIITYGCLIVGIGILALFFLVAAIVLLVQTAWPAVVVATAAIAFVIHRRHVRD
jgi:hypothetical protein